MVNSWHVVLSFDSIFGGTVWKFCFLLSTRVTEMRRIKAMSVGSPGQTWELFNSSWSANIWAVLQKLLWFPHNHLGQIKNTDFASSGNIQKHLLLPTHSHTHALQPLQKWCERVWGRNGRVHYIPPCIPSLWSSWAYYRVRFLKHSSLGKWREPLHQNQDSFNIQMKESSLPAVWSQASVTATWMHPQIYTH